MMDDVRYMENSMKIKYNRMSVRRSVLVLLLHERGDRRSALHRSTVWSSTILGLGALVAAGQVVPVYSSRRRKMIRQVLVVVLVKE